MTLDTGSSPLSKKFPLMSNGFPMAVNSRTGSKKASETTSAGKSLNVQLIVSEHLLLCNRMVWEEVTNSWPWHSDP